MVCEITAGTFSFDSILVKLLNLIVVTMKSGCILKMMKMHLKLNLILTNQMTELMMMMMMMMMVMMVMMMMMNKMICMMMLCMVQKGFVWKMNL